jgi:predicted unusual protein kinase regulating ubiquinone biosynthesis (AarF/ABC1/UbiB family)
MDDLLNEYIEQEKQLDSIEYEKDENGLCIEQCEIEERKYLDYIERTKEYYYKMTFGDFFRAVWFTASSAYICATEYLKYVIGWKSRNHAIINVSKRLASINMMYVKIFQAFATNRNIVSPELNDFFSKYTDNVNYTDDEYDINELKELERRSIECAPYRQLRILNDYRPIKSGLMSLIFKGVMNNPSESNGEGSESGGEEVVIKYLRKNINKNFTSSMNNLVVFAKLTRYVPYLRTLNVESLILQNIVCLKDQVNFRKELANIILYYRHWHKYEYVKIPKPYPEFTENINPDAIVMEYVHGMKITEIDPEDNDEFGKVLASFNAKAAFCTSFYHGDLHPGNILFIKNTSASAPPIHQICILDFGIIGHLSRYDQELLFRATKFMYKRKFDKIIDIIMSCELSESADMKSDTQSVIPVKNTERYESLRRELTEVLVRYTTPEIRFFGVAEIYELNYILNNYGLMFKRSLYRLFITLAIMDSIGTRLGSKMSYFQYMTDIVVDMFNINHSDEEDEAEEEYEAEEEADEEEDDEAEEEDEADEEEDDEAENNK